MTSRYARNVTGHGIYTPGRRLLAEIAAPPAFLDGRELCAQVDSELFFPDKGGATSEAKSICRQCPLQDPCLEYALERGERFGVWGGASERERRYMPRPARTQAPPPTPSLPPAPVRSCTHKTRYPTEQAALAAARRVTPDNMRTANHLFLGACTTCGGWYLTDKDAA